MSDLLLSSLEVASNSSATSWIVAREAWGFSGKNTAVHGHFLLQGILLTQGLNLCLLHWQAYSLPLCYLGCPGV